MQVVSFQVPRLYEDIPIQIGGMAENPVPIKFLMPYSDEEKKLGGCLGFIFFIDSSYKNDCKGQDKQI